MTTPDITPDFLQKLRELAASRSPKEKTELAEHVATTADIPVDSVRVGVFTQQKNVYNRLYETVWHNPSVLIAIVTQPDELDVEGVRSRIDEYVETYVRNQRREPSLRLVIYLSAEGDVAALDRITCTRPAGSHVVRTSVDELGAADEHASDSDQGMDEAGSSSGADQVDNDAVGEDE